MLQPRPDFYAAKRVGPEDACLLIEISDTSLSYDRKVKVPHYAQSGVPEIWIEDLKHDLLVVHRDPVGSTYQTTLTLRKGETVSPLAFPDIVFKAEDLLA